MSDEDDQAAIFGRSWIAANIFTGPHSMTDRPIVQDIGTYMLTAEPRMPLRRREVRSFS